MTAEPTRSDLGRRNRRRGADAERQVIAYLRVNGWPDARRRLAGDGRQGGDVEFEPGIHLECKDWNRPSWGAWRAQAVAECGARVPIVLRRTRGVRDVGEWRCHVRWADFLDMRGLPPDAICCTRTLAVWLDVPFREVVAELRRQREEVA